MLAIESVISTRADCSQEQPVTYPKDSMVGAGTVHEVEEVDFQPRVLQEIHLVRQAQACKPCNTHTHMGGT